MSKISPEVFYEGVDAIIAWDIDGVICPTRKVEQRLNKIIPAFIPLVQAIFQSSRGPFVDTRHMASYKFLSRRTINDDAVDALISSHEQAKELLRSKGLVIRNAIYTERPSPAKEIIFNQLEEKLASRGEETNARDLVEGYFDNPFGNDHRNVKPNAAKTLQDLNIEFHLVEDKRGTATRVKRAAPKTFVYFVVDSKGSIEFCERNDLIPVYSPREFVELAFKNIKSNI